jgi:glutamyl-tRNA reductase
MKLREGENFESWSRRVDMYERGIALQRIAEGEDELKVIEDMSRRITQKLLHPVFKLLQTPVEFDIQTHREKYQQALNGKTSSSDHVDNDFKSKYN